MKKIAINACYGGFSLSPEAVLDLYRGGMTELGCPVEDYWNPGTESFDRDGKYGLEPSLAKWRAFVNSGKCDDTLFLTVFSDDEKFVLTGDRNIARDNPRLIEVVERLGEKANGACAEIKIVEIPDGADWTIEEYDGLEWVAEKHRTWR